MANSKSLPLLLSLILLGSIFSMVEFETREIDILEEKNTYFAQGKRSTNAVQLNEQNNNFTLNGSNEWIWFEINNLASFSWLNLSIDDYDNTAYGEVVYMRAYSHDYSCVSTTISIYSWANSDSVCTISSANKTILVVIDLSNNGMRDWPFGNVSLTLTTSIYESPETIEPTDYQFPDGDLNSDSTSFQQMYVTNSASGYFESYYDDDYFQIDLGYSGIYSVNLTYDENHSVSTYVSSASCTNGEIENTSENYYNCFVYSDSITFSIYNYSSSFIEAEQWSVDIEISQVRPIEDKNLGDAPSFNLYQDLLFGSESIDGTYLSSGDTDWYSVNIEHGFDQKITILSENGAVIRFAESYIANTYCKMLKGNSLVMSSNVVISPDIETQLICDTNHFSDEIDFSISTSSYNYELGYNYSLTLSKVENNSGLGVADSNNILDAHGRLPLNSLQLGIHHGGFLYPSDTIDGYSIQVQPNSTAVITLESDCAIIQDTNPSYSRINSKTFVNSLLVEQQYNLIIQRSEQINSELPLAIYPVCEYKFNLSSENIASSWHPTLTGYLSLSTDVTMNDMAGEIAEQIASGSYISSSAMINIELAPNQIATITATQASGAPLMITASGSNYLSAEGEIKIAGMIEVGKNYVGWNNLYIHNIDGSPISIQMDLSTTQLLTDEVNEIKSLATGYLGISKDEGYDAYDDWIINNSDDASMISIRLTEVDAGLDVTIEGGISSTQCAHNVYNPLTGYYENGFDPVRVWLNHGSGKYALRVDKLYGECVSSSTNAPDVIPSGSAIKLNGNIYNSVGMSDQVNFQLVSKSLQVIASTNLGDITDWSLMTIPDDAVGEHYLHTIHANGFLLESSTIQVTNRSIFTSTGLYSLLDLNQNPTISVDSWLPYNNIPTEWDLQNIDFYQSTINGTEFLQSFSNMSGEGLEKIDFKLDTEVKQGTLIEMTAELVVDEIITPVNFIWKTGSIIFETECQASIQPVVGDPESDLICTILADYSQISYYSGSNTNVEIAGELLIYTSDGLLLESHDFKITDGRANIRIPTWHYSEGEYYAVATSNDVSNTTSIMNKIDNFFVDETLNPDSEYSVLGMFEFSAYSMKENAMAGDEIVIHWNYQGEKISAIKWTLTSGNYQDVSSFPIKEDSSQGTFTIDLPEDLDIQQFHIINIIAYSIYGQSQSEQLIIYGADNSPEVFVDINPQRPSVNEEFTVEIIAPDANEWLSYSWSLVHNNAILSSGDGWVNANEASFKANLPVMHFSSDVVLTVIIEDHSGIQYVNTVYITPMPLREIHVNTDGNAVSGEMFEFAFSVEGDYLNSIDSVKSATLRISSMNDIIIQEEVFIINSKNGEFSTMIPENTPPGTYMLEINFELLDGESFTHRELLTVMSEKEGISVFGMMTIPSLPHGIDTIIVSVLAIFLLVKGKRAFSARKERKNIDFDSLLEDVDDKPEEFTPTDFYSNTGFDPIAPVVPGISDSIIQNLEQTLVVQSPTYERTEHPQGSGVWWERDHSAEEWRKI
jgi:hypothetical protein